MNNTAVSVLARPATSRGFVVAMQAELTIPDRLPWREWIVVSRWGPGGDHLSVARTLIPAMSSALAPIDLTPRQTALARLMPLPPDTVPPTFWLERHAPEQMPLAGAFAPAEGCIRLCGTGARLRLRAEGRGLGADIRCAWRIDAERVPWLGEFIEEDA